jgi:hypothetical protein
MVWWEDRKDKFVVLVHKFAQARLLQSHKLLEPDHRAKKRTDFFV